MLTFALSRTLPELYAILVIFYDTGGDVTPISPPGGVTSQIELQILKSIADFLFVINVTFAQSRTLSELNAILVILFVKPEVT